MFGNVAVPGVVALGGRVRNRLLMCGVLVLLAACQQQSPATAEPTPQQAGKPMDPLQTAAKIADAHGAALRGDNEAAAEAIGSMQDDLRRAVKLPDVMRRIDPVEGRAAANRVEGVRSAVWIDHENLLALVNDAAHRSQQTIDRICLEMEPLGDTLGVVVNLQNATAKNADELKILSRNCQLAPGDRAFMQRERQVDVVAPEVRRQYKAMKLEGEALKAELEKQERAMRALEASTPPVR